MSLDTLANAPPLPCDMKAFYFVSQTKLNVEILNNQFPVLCTESQILWSNTPVLKDFGWRGETRPEPAPKPDSGPAKPRDVLVSYHHLVISGKKHYDMHS
jgi:hypothetical protein